MTGDCAYSATASTPELSYGLNKHVEAAAYFLTNKAPGQGVQSDGLKVRARWRAFIPTEQTIWYGAVNMELGKLARRFNTAYSNGEIKAILTARSGPWVAGINLNIDRPLRLAAAAPATNTDVYVTGGVRYYLTPQFDADLNYNNFGGLTIGANFNF